MSAKIYIDTNVFIEAVEKQSGQMPAVARAVLSIVDSGAVLAVLSELVVAELLVKPFQNADRRLIDVYSQLFTPQFGYRTCPVDRNTLLEAARQRAINPSTKLPDAIHVATAQLQGCKAFLTIEVRLRMPPDLIRLNLDSSTLTELEALA